MISAPRIVIKQEVDTPLVQKIFDALPSAHSQLDLEMLEYKIIKLSPDLDLEINRMVDGADSLDSSEFQAVGT